MAPAKQLLARKSVLLVAHPGHELLIHGWLGAVRPEVFILTDGSGHAGKPRVAASKALLERAGAPAGSVFGRFSDRELYAAILAGDHAPFVAVAKEIATAMTASGARVIVADGVEGYNPVHDLCRVIAGAASAMNDGGVEQYEYSVVGGPSSYDSTGPDVIHHHLEDGAYAEKMAEARTYAAVLTDVDSMLSRWSADAFRHEAFRQVHDWRDCWPPGGQVHYESFGEDRVSFGRYSEVIRYRDHILPLREALCESVASARCAS